jgi:hypothetical protein
MHGPFSLPLLHILPVCSLSNEAYTDKNADEILKYSVDSNVDMS